MAITGKLVQPGQYSYYKVMLGGLDITSIVAQTEIFQDIFSPTWSATITLMDATNIQNSKGINVGDDATIIIETKCSTGGGGSKSYNFVIQSISQKTLIKKNVYGYLVHLVPEVLLTDLKTRLQKYYEKKPPEVLVNLILGDAGLGTAKTDSDPNKYDVIIPNWTGFTAVEWICQFAKLPGNGADFVFFQEDNGGAFKFKSVETLFGEKAGHVFVHKEANYREDSNKEDKDSFKRLLKYKFISELDGIKNMAMGFFGNTSIAHDIINKKIVTTPYLYSEDNSEDQTRKPYKGGAFEAAENSCIAYRTLHEGMTPITISLHETHDQWRGSRRSNQMKLDTNRLLIEVPGDAGMWEALGKSVEIMLPPQEDITDSVLDKYYKGDYLVMALRHVITDSHYYITAELGKKRLEKSL